MKPGRVRNLPASSLPGVTVVATVVAVALLSIIGAGLSGRIEEWVGHGLGHLVVALPLTVLAITAVRRWPPPRPSRVARAARTIVVVAFIGVAAGQLLEAFGARVDERRATYGEVLAHTVGQIVTMLSMPVLLLGAVLSLAAAAKAGTMPKWMAVVVAIIAVAILYLMSSGAPDPNA